MSEQDKAREFWLLDDDEVGGYFFYEKQIECDWHVIEHSAYAALAKENVGYAELNKIQKIYLTAAEKEITSLRESLSLAEQDRDSWKRSHKILQDAAKGEL